MANIYTGQVQGLCKCTGTTTAGSLTAFCRKVSGGTFNRNPNNIRNVGIGAQLQVLKGIDEITLDWRCVGPAKTDVALWFPTAAGVTVGSFPNFLVEVDDGSNGQELVLYNGQPATCTIAWTENGQVEYTFSAKFASVTEIAAGTNTPVYNSYRGHQYTAVAYNSTAKGTQSWTLSNDLGCTMFNTADTKSADSRTLPAGYVVTTQSPRFQAVVTDEHLINDMDGDNWTSEDTTIALANGVTAEDCTITLHDFVPSSFSMPLEAEGIVGFGIALEPGGETTTTLYNRVTFA